MLKTSSTTLLIASLIILWPCLLLAQTHKIQLTGEADSTDLDQISKIRAEIEHVELTMDVEALRNLKRHFAEDVAMMPGQRVVYGADNIIAFHEDLYTRFDSFDVRFIIESIHVLGGLAVEKGRTEGMVYPVGGPPRKNAGTYLCIYERNKNNEWKMVRFSW